MSSFVIVIPDNSVSIMIRRVVVTLCFLMGLLMMPMYVIVRYCWMMNCHYCYRVLLLLDRWHGMRWKWKLWHLLHNGVVSEMYQKLFLVGKGSSATVTRLIILLYCVCLTQSS